MQIRQDENREQHERSEDGRDAVVRHLLEAIDRVRADVAEVELWASALGGFMRPIPDYDPGGVQVWLPKEQATALGRGKRS